mmetsp:Transcript_5716/g.13651  ORF Transcript_5716/g.13651 Transcript_5716/m.13651 type:complete len:447 (-) Transcript_5716:521-1861(-)
MCSATASTRSARPCDIAATRSSTRNMALAAHSGALRLALGAVLVHLSSCATTTPRSAFVALRALGVAPRHAAISRGTSIGSRMAIGETFDKRPTNGKTDRIKNLLTQRAVQTQLYTLSFSGDLNTFEFLECFKDHHGLCDLHDHGALKVGWKEYLFDLIQSKQHDKVTKKTLYRGGSANNPYLQDAAVSMEFTTTIRPAILADNIMALRQDIAVEWLSDLKLVAAENDELMRQHLAMVTEMEDPAGKLMYSSLQLDDSSTPLRKSNYDLLCKMVTEVAIQNTVKEMSNRRSEEVAANWLQKHMDTTAAPLFARSEAAQHQRDVGKTFLQGLLRETPKVVRGTLRDADEVTLVDPLDIAARIMAERQVPALTPNQPRTPTQLTNPRLVCTAGCLNPARISTRGECGVSTVRGTVRDAAEVEREDPLDIAARIMAERQVSFSPRSKAP